jgi:hypothetical protein
VGPIKYSLSVWVGDLTYDPFGAFDCLRRYECLYQALKSSRGSGKSCESAAEMIRDSDIVSLGWQPNTVSIMAFFDDYASETFIFSTEVEEEIDALNHFGALGVQVVEELYALGEQAEPKVSKRIEEQRSFACNQPTHCEKLGLNICLATCPFTGVVLPTHTAHRALLLTTLPLHKASILSTARQQIRK